MSADLSDLSDLSDLTRLARERWETGAHGDAHLRVAADVWTAMREAGPPAPGPRPWKPNYGVAVGLLSIPIVVDDDLTPGVWRLVANSDRAVRQEGVIGGAVDHVD